MQNLYSYTHTNKCFVLRLKLLLLFFGLKVFNETYTYIFYTCLTLWLLFSYVSKGSCKEVVLLHFTNSLMKPCIEFKFR